MSFVKISPQAISVAPVTEFALDVQRNFSWLKQPQAPHVAAAFNPLAVLNILPSRAYEEFYIKLPGSPVFVPDWLAQSNIPQAVVDHRKATSQCYDDEGWGVIYEKHFVYQGKFPREGLQSIHTDDRAIDIARADGRTSTSYLVSSSIPARFFGPLKSNVTPRDYTQMALYEEHYTETFEYEEADVRRDRFFARHLADSSFSSVSAGVLTCFNGMVIHSSGIAEESGERAMLHFRMFELMAPPYGRNFQAQLAKNPPLFDWYKKHLAPAA